METIINVTNASLAADWGRINNMTFVGMPIVGTTKAPRVYLSADPQFKAIYDRKVMDTFPDKHDCAIDFGHVWSDKAIETVKASQTYVDAIVHRTLKWVEKRDKAIENEEPIPAWKRANVAYSYRGRTLPRKERTKILPLTKEQEEARIARNRARLGLA